MTGIMQPPGHGGEYVTDYGKDDEPLYKTDPNKRDDERRQALERGLPDPYPENGPIGGGSPDQILHRPQPGSGPPPIASPDGFAIASLFLSLVWLGGLGSLLAVIFGHTSWRSSRAQGCCRPIYLGTDR